MKDRLSIFRQDVLTSTCVDDIQRCFALLDRLSTSDGKPLVIDVNHTTIERLSQLTGALVASPHGAAPQLIQFANIGLGSIGNLFPQPTQRDTGELKDQLIAWVDRWLRSLDIRDDDRGLPSGLKLDHVTFTVHRTVDEEDRSCSFGAKYTRWRLFLALLETWPHGQSWDDLNRRGVWVKDVPDLSGRDKAQSEINAILESIGLQIVARNDGIAIAERQRNGK